MIDREDLKEFSRTELEDIILSNLVNPFVSRYVDNLILEKRNAKFKSIESEMEKLHRDKEQWLNELKETYQVDNDKDLFAKMSFKERLEYISKIEKINELWDKESKAFDEEHERFESKYGKK